LPLDRPRYKNTRNLRPELIQNRVLLRRRATMAEKVNTLVKIRNAEREAVNQFLQERFSEVFSKVKANQKDAAQTRYSGGSIIRPWGFKAVSAVQSSSDDALIVKLWGKPKFQQMGYIAMLLVIGSF